MGFVSVNTEETLQRIFSERFIAIVRRKNAAELVPKAEALIAAGVKVIEFTLDTIGALDALRTLSEDYPDILWGVGTVLTEKQVDEASLAGAAFAISPVFEDWFVPACHRLSLVAIPAGFTPNELWLAHQG